MHIHTYIHTFADSLTKRAGERDRRVKKRRAEVLVTSFESSRKLSLRSCRLIGAGSPVIRQKYVADLRSIGVRFLQRYLYLPVNVPEDKRTRVLFHVCACIHVHTHACNARVRMNGVPPVAERHISLVSGPGDLTTTCLIFPRAPRENLSNTDEIDEDEPRAGMGSSKDSRVWT